ncbi:MAG: hypothetical protein H6707_13315 [Deltaproteobacteria bacterium]|nr:hypothetical protein [Deltaproteobacteria bacterium]
MLKRNRWNWALVTLLLCGAPACGSGSDLATDDSAIGANDGGLLLDSSAIAADSASAPDGTVSNGYSEPICQLTDVTAISKNHSAAKLRETLVALAKARYPIAVAFIDAQKDAQLQAWFNNPGDFSHVIERFEVAVHEGCHLWGFANRKPGRYAYRLTEALSFDLPNLQNFNRDQLVNVHKDVSHDFYAKTYLTGQSGAQDFTILLDEYNAYVHSLATRYCTRDLMPANRATSAKDGILTFMYYVGAYLKLAREQYPDDYNEIIADAKHVEMILAIWDRAEFYLKLTENMPKLQIREQLIRGWTYAPEIVAEIDRLRKL